MSTSSRARKLLFASSGDDNLITKFRSRRDDGRELYEIIDQSTGDTRAFQFHHPDGQCRDMYHPARLYEGL